MEAVMDRLPDKNFLERAHEVLLLGILWSGLAICTLGAMAYDFAHWFSS
jgi:hypothetical protein